MSDYLHHVAMRIMDEPTGSNAMILPGASMAFPLHINNEQEEIVDEAEHQNDVSTTPIRANNDQPVNVTRFFEKREANGQSSADVTSSYIQPRLQPADLTPVEHAPEKHIKVIETLQENELPTTIVNNDSMVQKVAPHVIEHKHETVTFETQKVHTIQLKEVSTQSKIQQPEVVPQSHILPQASPPIHKVPSPNRLTIGKITVEIVRPAQPQVQTKERIITRIVSATPKDSDGPNKLSYGLRQF